jgi:hypothetical protein
VDGDGARIVVKDTVNNIVFEDEVVATLDDEGAWSVDLVDPWGVGIEPQGFGFAVKPSTTYGTHTPLLWAVDEGTTLVHYADLVAAAANPLDPTGLEQANTYTDAAVASEAGLRVAGDAGVQEAAEAYTDVSLARRSNGFFARVPDLVMWDDFARPDQTIATSQIEGTQAPTGHLYTADLPITPGIIEDGEFRWTDETSIGGTPIRILATKLERLPETIAARFAFTPGTTTGHNAVVGACAVSFSQGSIQLAVWPDQWKIFCVPNPIVDPYPVLASGTIDPPLAQDGTEYDMTLRYDPATSSLTADFGNGQSGTATDAQINQYWGNRVCWQLRRENSTDGAVRWSAIAAGSSQPTPSGIPAALDLPYTHGTYVATSQPAGIGQDLQLVSDCVPAGGWVSGQINCLQALWGGTGHQSWAWTVAANGKHNLYVSLTGSDTNLLVSSVATPTDANRVKVTYDHTSGDAKFYYSLDHGDTYTQLGTTQNLSGGGAPFAVPAQVPLQVGTRNNASTLMFGGLYSLAEVYDGIGGALVAQADFSAAWNDRTYLDAFANTWRIVGSGWSWSVPQTAITGLSDDLDAIRSSITPPLYPSIIAFKTADQVLAASSTTRQDVTFNTPMALEASSTYLLEAFIPYDATTTGDFAIGWTVPAGATMGWSVNGPPTTATASTSTPLNRSHSGAAATPQIGGVGNGSVVVARPAGWVTTSTTPGNLVMQAAQVTSDPTAPTVHLGAWVKLTKIA